MTTRKNKKMTASQQRKRSHFHYLGGSVSLQAERERRMELEERLIDAREEVRKQAQTLQPTVEALVGAVRAIEQGADEQLLLADQTQQTFESLRNEISTLRHELKKDIRKSKDHSRKELDNYKKKMEETMQNDREKYTKQINSLKAEMALLRSEFVAHRDTVKERLDVIPESFEEMVKIASSESFISTLTFGSILASFFKKVFPDIINCPDLITLGGNTILPNPIPLNRTETGSKFSS